jgi:hypothetical protein
VFKGMMQRRMYTFLKGQERARIGAAGISSLQCSAYTHRFSVCLSRARLGK